MKYKLMLYNILVCNGDVIAMLYTNSPAMHSSLMREFSETVAAAPMNVVVVSIFL